MFLMMMMIWFSKTAGGDGMAAEATAKIREMAAMETQGMSIRKLESYLSRHPNEPREPVFLNRLADLHLEKSGISFQYTEGESVRTHHQYFTTSLKAAIRTLDRLIRQHPNHPLIPEAYFKRARANRELGKFGLSRNDLLFLVSNHPDFPYMDSVLLDLSIYAQEDNHHAEALKYLARIQEMPDSPYYEISCRKAAWSRFNLGQHRTAIQLLEKELVRYGKDTGNPPELESAWQDAALFSFEGLNRKSEFTSISQVMNTLEKTCEIRNRNTLTTCHGTAFLKLGKLLKAYRMGSELEELKDHMVRKHLTLPETLELSLLLHQYWMEKREYGKIALIIEEASTIAEKQELQDRSRILKVIRESLTELHSLTAKNSRSTQVRQLLDPLDGLTRIQIKLSNPDDPSCGEFRFAMAESAFSAKHFTLARHWYEELLQNRKTIPKKWGYASIRLRWIASGFEEWKSIPPTESKHLSLMKKWIKDTELLNDDPSPESESFQLEAMKWSLEQGDRNESLSRIEKFSFKASQHAIRSEAASIVFDQRMKAGETEALVAPCGQKTWMKIDSVAEPCKMIVTRHLLATGKAEEAAKQIKHLRSSPAVSLLKSQIHLKLGRLDLAILDQESWLEQTEWKDRTMAQSVFLQHWLNRNRKSYERYFRNGKERNAVGEIFLEPFIAAKELEETGNEKRWNAIRYPQRYRASIRTGKSAIPLWALTALTHPDKIPFQDRIVLLQRISSSWDQVDPYLQIRFLPMLGERVQSTLASIRRDGPSIAPIRGDELSIERRVQMLKEIDLVFGKTLKLDWMEIKIRTLRELQLVYRDFVRDLRKSGTPENLIQPFLSKQDELGSAEQKLLSMILQPNRPLDATSLIDQRVMESIPKELHESWNQAAARNQPDLLQFLITQLPTSSRLDELRGLILCALLREVATTEGMRLMMNGRSNR